MTNRDEIKRQHEEAVCRIFLDEYNKIYSTGYKFIRLADPPEPDCICSDGLNIEVVTAYYNENEAKDLWELAERKITVKEYNQRSMGNPFIENPDGQLKDFLDENIQNKLKKRYQYKGLLWLVISVQAPLTEDSKMEQLIAPYKNIKDPFSEIIILNSLLGR